MTIENSKVRSVLFDMDGVIISTDKDHFAAWTRAFKEELNYQLDDEDIHLVRGISRTDSLKALLTKHNLQVDTDKFDKIAELKNALYLESLEKLTPNELFEGVEDFLKFIKEDNKNIVLVSSSKNASKILEKTNLLHYFDYIVDVSKIYHLKPDPEIFIEGAKFNNVDHSNCVVIEDSQAGLTGAKKAGMLTVAFNPSKQTLTDYDLEVNGFYDLINYLKEN